MQEQWYAVRCCCGPAQAFGFISLPADRSSAVVRTKDGRRHEVQIRPVVKRWPGRLSQEYAVNSDNLGLEFWRSVQGFIEIQWTETG